MELRTTDGLWYALRVRARFEKIVAVNLRNKGYDEFVPTYISKRRWSDRIKTLELPLFPGYIFCRFDLKARLPILTTPGVSFIVGVGRIPKAIDETEIAAVKAVIASGLPCEPWPYLKIGQRVRIEHGSLCGLEGLVIDVKKTPRLVISVNLLMRSVSIEIDRDWVRPIDVAQQRGHQNRFVDPSLLVTSGYNPV